MPSQLMMTDASAATQAAPAAMARRLVRRATTASLATAFTADRWPYASLVLVACDHDAAPLLLISRLAEHTRHIAEDNRIALLFDATDGLEDRLSGARLTLLGRARLTAAPRHRARFLARHPDATGYADFTDFAFFEIDVSRAHLVAGFGRIDWIESGELLFDATECGALAESEADILAHMNRDHADAIALYAARLLGKDGGDWVMTGCDPEGCDLRRAGCQARLDFPAPVRDAESACAMLIELVERARRSTAQPNG